MNNKLFIQQIDEFNYTSVINFCKDKNGSMNDSAVLCLPGFEVMFYNFDKIITSKLQNASGILYLSDLVVKKKLYEDLKQEAEKYSNQYNILSDVQFLVSNYMGGEHVYEFVFRSLSLDMLLKQRELYKPKKEDYELVKSQLSHISKKIVTINGRNLEGNRAGRNNTFFDLIKFLTDNGCFVVNCTLPNPKFNSYFNDDSYLEVDEKELFGYSKNISYFVNSDCLISISDAGGITNHLCTKSNIILYGPGPCVNDANFGAENKSQYEISKEFKQTFVETDFKEILDIVNNINRPSDVSFFDESKIIYC